MPSLSTTGFKEVLGCQSARPALRYSCRSHAALVSEARSVVFSEFVMRSKGS